MLGSRCYVMLSGKPLYCSLWRRTAQKRLVNGLKFYISRPHQCVAASLHTSPVCFDKLSNPPPEYGKYAQADTFESFMEWFADTGLVQGMATLLRSTHDITGAPWWLTILVCTVALRGLITTPLMCVQLKSTMLHAKYQAILTQLSERLRKEVKTAAKQHEWSEQMQRHQFHVNIARHNKRLREQLKPPGWLKRFSLPWVQLPLWIAVSTALRDLTFSLQRTSQHSAEAYSTFMQLSDGGCAWFTNLCVPDPYYILPVLMCCLNLAVVEIYNLPEFNRILATVMRVLSVVLLPVACQVPSGVVLYWCCSSGFGVAQALLLQSPRVNRLFGFPPPQSRTPYRDLLHRVSPASKWAKS